MTRDQLQQIRDALVYQSSNAAKEAVDILDRELAAPEQEPFCYVNVNAQGDVTRTVKREDKWCKTPLYRHPAPQSAQEPVAWMYVNSDGECEDIGYGADYGSKEALFVPLYTAPPSREWQGLTDEEADSVVRNSNDAYECVRMTTAALRKKNSGEQA